MTSVSQRSAFHQIIQLDNLIPSTDALMRRILSQHGRHRKRSLLPTLIGLDVEYEDSPESLVPLRIFMKSLRVLHHNHFVRFVSDVLWMMQSDSDDIFYAHDEPKDHGCDVIWKIKVLDTKRVMVSVSFPNNRTHQVYVNNLCKAMMAPIAVSDIPQSTGDFCQVMLDFFLDTVGIEHLDTLPNNLHILFIPDRTKRFYTPVPLYGLMHTDAQRRYDLFLKEMNVLNYHHADILRNPTSEVDTAGHLITMIQDNEEAGSRRKSAQSTYALAEILFGVFSAEDSLSESDHDMVLFDLDYTPAIPDVPVANAYCLATCELFQNN